MDQKKFLERKNRRLRWLGWIDDVEFLIVVILAILAAYLAGGGFWTVLLNALKNLVYWG